MSIWKALGGNIHTLDSILEETRQDCNSTRRHSRIRLQTLETASKFLVTPSEHSRDDVKIYPDDVKDQRWKRARSKREWGGRGVKEKNHNQVLTNEAAKDGVVASHVSNSGKAYGSVTSNVGNSPSPAGNVPNYLSFAIKVKVNTIQKTINFLPLFTPAGNGVDVHVPKESGKFGLVESMMIKDMHFFKFGSKEGMEAMLESGPWLIRNVPLILKQWTLDANIMNEDVCEASYARAMIELKVDVDLRDTIVFVANGNPNVQTDNKATTPILNSFDALSTLVDKDDEGGNQTPSTNATRMVAKINKLKRQMLDEKLILVDEHGKPLERKVTNEALASKPNTSMGGQLEEYYKDEFELPDDETSRYMSSSGGGGFCKDDFDFYDGYEAQVYDFPE
ncbi:zinc knuckle CX2CX4HX4C containing protein [Tanacetum coccineum]|uniref:Zinc knuckle CX2CX4HX4C containing protein n=1 Tax=Tanacetum coccineum TaxID=301880 RepID=A0ABQ5DK83_9ASTR